jgi:potassium channel subfamily K
MFAISLSILGSLGGMVWVVSWLLDQFEARCWAAGGIGKPWYMDENMVMYVGGGALAMWIGVNMVLFTTVVHFYTPGGETRPLDKFEAIYVCVQIITTVGYGDFTPSDTASQAAVAAIILVGVVLVATVVTEFLKVLARRTERTIHRLTHSQAHSEVERRASLLSIAEASPEADDDIPFTDQVLTQSMRMDQEVTLRQAELFEETTKARLRMLMDFVNSTAPFVLTVAVGTVFFSKYPGEDKTMWQAFYMSCVTLTTVGFGQFTADTPGGKFFAALWMFVGVGATAHMVLCFGNTFLLRHREIQVDQLRDELFAEMDSDGDQRVDKCEFLRFELIRTGLCEKEFIDSIIARFDKLDVDQSGTIDIEDLRAIKHKSAELAESMSRSTSGSMVQSKTV